MVCLTVYENVQLDLMVHWHENCNTYMAVFTRRTNTNFCRPSTIAQPEILRKKLMKVCIK